MTALALENVSVTLGGFTAVDGLTATFAEGEWAVVIGPNGAGKTTLLRAIAGLVSFDGRVEVRGRSARELPRRELARQVAVVPQSPSTPPWMTVFEYVLLGRTPYLGVFSHEGPEDLEAAHRALERLDLTAFSGRDLGTLSGGERQRAVVARALAQEAPIVLLDEPTSALDIGHQQQALELLDSLREEVGLTLVAAMHDLTLAAQYADRLLLLDNGCLVADGEPRLVATEELISAHYDASVEVLPLEGTIAVIPRRARRSERR
jgi:iron complex transport system ATP-binding protein